MAKAKSSNPAITSATTTEGTAPAAAQAAPVQAVPEKVKVERDRKNGVTRPSAGSTAKVWTIADEISATNKAPAKRKEVLTKALEQGVNPATAATQFGRWCRYHGLSVAREKKVETAAPTAPSDVTVAPAAVPAAQ